MSESTNHLPEQSLTWGWEVESYEDWQTRQDHGFSSECTALLMYLSEQLRIEGDKLPEYNHSVLGMLNDSSLVGCRVQELLFAYLALKLSEDNGPALEIIRGQRLMKNLHPEYVDRTHCYTN